MVRFHFSCEQTRMSDSNGNLKLWMTQLPNSLKDLPLINLAIPGKYLNKRQFQYFYLFILLPVFYAGSHDSMSYGINKRAKVAPDAEPVVNDVYKVLPCVVRRWAITQQLNTFQQLTYGIRYGIGLNSTKYMR